MEGRKLRLSGGYFNNLQFQYDLSNLNNSPSTAKLDKLVECYLLPIAENYLNSREASVLTKNADEDTKLDIRQECIIKMMSVLDRFDPTRGTGFNFLTKVCKNVIREHVQKYERRAAKEILVSPIVTSED